MPPRDLPHLRLRSLVVPESYARPPRRMAQRRLVRPQEPGVHGDSLQTQLNAAWQESERRANEIRARVVGVPEPDGFRVRFRCAPGFPLTLAGLDTKGDVRLLNVHLHPLLTPEEKAAGAPDVGGKPQSITVFVPRRKLGVLTAKIQKFSDEAAGRDLSQTMANTEEIRSAALDALWTDDPTLLPGGGQEVTWEVWLVGDDEGVADRFRSTAGLLGITVLPGVLRFLDRTVLLARCTRDQLEDSVEVLDQLAELRLAKVTAEQIRDLPPVDQAELVAELRGRTEAPPAGAPFVCLLDTGVLRAHPLLEDVVRPEDLHAVDAGSTVPTDPHGTEMAGLALYGDLTERLLDGERFSLLHGLESVLLLRHRGGNPDRDLHGSLTVQAVSRPEAAAPNRRRIFSMAVTCDDTRDRGRPSSWSAAVDQLAYGEESENKRLFLVSAGNSDGRVRHLHPDHLPTELIHDPGQSWNALTVGAYTDKSQVEGEDTEGWRPAALPGDLSPSTTTSLSWAKPWPLKPDLVLEGGNEAVQDPPLVAHSFDSLSLLTTAMRLDARLLEPVGETSAAVSLAARMAGEVWAQNPDLRPETVRALLVHSAEWTKKMRARYQAGRRRSDVCNLVRACGFGVPDEERAARSARNSVTLVAEEKLQPFERVGGASGVRLGNLNLHRLPWPTDVLEGLGGEEVRLRVTLSYFIEPNPSRRGYIARHSYACAGLRFDLQLPTETEIAFRHRINEAARAAEGGDRGEGDHSAWTLGPENRHRGSIHNDVWTGTAADLAASKALAIFPVGGWWKHRLGLGRWQREIPYSLVMSVQTQDEEVDLYTPIQAQINVPVEVEVQV